MRAQFPRRRRLDPDHVLAEEFRRHLQTRIGELESQKTSGAWIGTRTSQEAAASARADRARRRELDRTHATIARLDKLFPPRQR